MFSITTIMEILECLQYKTNSELEPIFLKHQLSNVFVGTSKLNKLTNISKHLYDNQSDKDYIESIRMLELLDESIQYLITEINNSKRKLEHSYGDDLLQQEYNMFNNKLHKIKRFLNTDGYTITDNKIVKIVPSVIDIQEKENLLFLLLNKYNFTTSRGHIDQAIHSFTDGNWASCNAQLRTFVESLFTEMAEKINNTTYSSSHSARISLSTGPNKIFYGELNEWDNSGKGFVNAFWKRLHPAGSHPGLSDEYDSSFRLNIVLITMTEMLRRFDNLNI